MVLALLLVMGCASEQDEVLTKYGLKPNEVIAAQKGKYVLRDGSFIELLGFVDMRTANPVPWNFEGKPLSPEAAKQFWTLCEIDEQAREENRTGESRRRFAILFRTPEDPNAADLKSWVEDRDIQMSRSLSRAKDEEEGVPFRCESMEFGFPTNKPLHIVFEVQDGEWKELAQFEFKDHQSIGDFSIDMQQEEREAFRATANEKQTVTLVAFALRIKMPKSLRPLDLRVVTNDPRSTSEVGSMFPLGMSGHVNGDDLEDENVRGYDLFDISAEKRDGFRRRFTLQARPKLRVEFRNIPLKPKS
jgi:hypothetical protein